MHLSSRLIRLSALGACGAMGLGAVLHAIAHGFADTEYEKVLAAVLLAGFWGLLVGALLAGMKAGSADMVARFHRQYPE